MRSGLEELAYMNDDGTLYLLLEDTVYAIDVNMGKMDVPTKTSTATIVQHRETAFLLCVTAVMKMPENG